MNFFVIEHLLHSTANANDDEHIKTRPLKITIITKETSVVFFSLLFNINSVDFFVKIKIFLKLISNKLKTGSTEKKESLI